MPNLRIDSGAVELTINDGPEVLIFNPSDINFAKGFYNLLKTFNSKQKEYEERARVIDANTTLDADGLPANIADGMALIDDICNFTFEQIDLLFGKGASKKVFGELRTINMFEQFFQGITPYLRSARAPMIEKYVKHSKRKAGAVMS
jgi:hypothetical protein